MEETDGQENPRGSTDEALRDAIIEALKCFGSDATALIAQAKATRDRKILFTMWQLMREAYLKEFCGSDKAPVLVKLKNGEQVVAKNYDDAINLMKG